MLPIAGTAAAVLFVLLATRNTQRRIERNGGVSEPRTWRRY